jgi:hypothetical protein
MVLSLRVSWSAPSMLTTSPRGHLWGRASTTNQIAQGETNQFQSLGVDTATALFQEPRAEEIALTPSPEAPVTQRGSAPGDSRPGSRCRCSSQDARHQMLSGQQGMKRRASFPPTAAPSRACTWP